jgi:radical SAM-linked protein
MSEVRQRWRLVFARDEEARYLSHLDAVTLWERALRRGGVPVATTEGFSPRPKLVFAAPLQLGMLGEHELADLYLSERLTLPQARASLLAGLPAGYRLVDLHDVWTGAPALAPQLAAADYRLLLRGAEARAVRRAASELLAAERLQRERQREAKRIAYDLRPLLLDLEVADAPRAAEAEDAASAAGIRAPESNVPVWMRLRHSQDRGSGRPDEVVAALAERLGLIAPADGEGGTAADLPAAGAMIARGGRLEVARGVRERLWLVEELEPSTRVAMGADDAGDET